MALSRLFPGRNVAAMHTQLAQFAAGFGVSMRLTDHLPNTRRPLAMAEHARDRDRLHPFREAAMEAHWSRGEDIERDDVLKRLADEAGLDPDAALAAADSPAMQARVDAMGEEARAWGVSGIPTYFLLPDGWSPGDAPPTNGARPVKIVGCQPYETLLAGCMRAQVSRRSG